METGTLLKDHYIRVLTDIITAKNPELKISSIDGILDNLHLLTKKSDFADPNNVTQNWLPVEYKRMLMYILFEGKALLRSSITQFEPGKYAVASASLTSLDGSIIYASCEKRISFEDVCPFAGYTDCKRNTIMQCYALGGAESKALTYAGIGMEFCGDIKEDIYLSGTEGSGATTSEAAFAPEIAQEMNRVMDESASTSCESHDAAPAENPAPAPDDDADFKDQEAYLTEHITVSIGKFAGKKLSEIDHPGKIGGWLLANFDYCLLDPNSDQETYKNLKAYVEMNPAAKKAYGQTIRQYQSEKEAS